MPLIASIPVRLSGPAMRPVSVAWATRAGTVAAGTGFVAASGVVAWGPGEQVKNIAVTIPDGALEGVFYVDLTDPSTGAVIGIPISTITLSRAALPTDLAPLILSMLTQHWAYIQRATGEAATTAGMPPLVTAEGLVLNNQHAETVLGGYLPDGAASSEGISLMMRGVAQAYAATADESYLDYFEFLLDAACTYFFFDARPPATGQWPHTWLVHGKAPFAVRGPIPESGALDQAGNIGVPLTFTSGIGQLPGLAPDVVYQVATSGSEFVWNNVLADIVAGTGNQVQVAYYIDAYGNKVFGTQKGGGFGQPTQAGSSEPPGKIVLTEPLTGTHLVNYCVRVPGTTVAYGEAYEGWPMWRKLMPGETSVASDAIHWFFDAFNIMAGEVPESLDYARARSAILLTWQRACVFEGADTIIFKAGALGTYNNHPLTYAYAYGRENIDVPGTEWEAQPPHARLPAARTPDGYVTFTLPDMSAEEESGDPIRYGMTFENNPIFLTYTSATKVSVNMMADPATMAEIDIVAANGLTHTAVARPTTLSGGAVEIPIPAFRKYQTEPGDSDGLASGDWSDAEDWTPPVYAAVPFPGRRAALVGDSITYQNTLYWPPTSGRFAYHSFGLGGWWNWAMGLANHPLELEPGIQPNVNGTNSGYQFGIAGSKVADWWDDSFTPIPGGPTQMGPMYAYQQRKSSIDIVSILGGTNDLAANITAPEVLLNLKKAAYECAADGKWVFIQTIMPRTTDLLNGYTLTQQGVVRQRIKDVNQGLRDWISTVAPPNIFLVDTWDLLVGPNGDDPHGRVSNLTNPLGASTVGNWKPGVSQVQFFPDGLHPSVAGSRIVGEKLAAVLTAAGVPVRAGGAIGPLTQGANLLANPSFIVTPTPRPTYSTLLGRAIGLGAARTDAPGYAHGVVPDHWFFYRASNQDGESYSNFGEYSWGALAGAYPEVVPYMAEPTWLDGAAVTTVTTASGRPALRVQFSPPAGNSRNESFVIRSNVPERQNGPWNAYGFDTWPQTPPPTNTSYAPGDRVGAEATILVSAIAGLHTLRMSLNFLSINDAAVGAGDNSTTGAVISGLAFGQNFWPPSNINAVRYHTDPFAMRLKTPFVVAPTPGAGQRTYAQMNIEVSVDASASAGNIDLLIVDPAVYVAGGPAL